MVKRRKRRDLSLCKNWRGIMLPSVANKVLYKIILERMKDSLDDRLRNEQAGFRKERSCCVQIATLRLLILWMRRCYGCSYGTTGSLRKSEIWVFYDGFQARVLHDGDMTEPFSMSTGSDRVTCSAPFSSSSRWTGYLVKPLVIMR